MQKVISSTDNGDLGSGSRSVSSAGGQGPLVLPASVFLKTPDMDENSGQEMTNV